MDDITHIVNAVIDKHYRKTTDWENTALSQCLSISNEAYALATWAIL